MQLNDSKPSVPGSRPSTVEEREADAAASGCLAVGGTTLRRPSSSSKPPPPLPARAPHVAAGSHASSSNGVGNSRSSSRSVGHAVAKPPTPSFLPLASSGSSVRGKGWVAGVSDSLGLSLSGCCSAALRAAHWLIVSAPDVLRLKLYSRCDQLHAPLSSH